VVATLEGEGVGYVVVNIEQWDRRQAFVEDTTHPAFVAAIETYDEVVVSASLLDDGAAVRKPGIDLGYRILACQGQFFSLLLQKQGKPQQ